MKFESVVEVEISFKDISYLELWVPFCSVEQNHLCTFGKGHYVKFILNLDQCFSSRCLLNIILIWSSRSPFVHQSGTICAILVEDILRHNSMNLFCIWASGSDVV